MTELEKLTPELEKIVNDGQEIFKLKVETDLRKELDVDKLKEQLETVKDMSKKNIAKLGQLDKIGITPNQAKDKEPEELFKLASENLTKILEDNKTQTDETVKKELNEYKEKYANALKKQEDKEKEFKTQLEQTISGYEQKEYFGKVKEKVLNIADKFTFITTDESGIKKIKETEIKDFPNEFKVDLATDTVTRPDGSPYIVDDKIVIKTLDEAVKYKFSGWTAKAGIGSEGEGKKKEDEKPGFEKPSGNTLASLIEKDKAYVSE